MTQRLDELFQELNDIKTIEEQVLYINKAIVAYPQFGFYLKEAYTYFDWVDFPIEDMKPTKTWEYHWSMAPNKALSKYAINSIEQVFKNKELLQTTRMRKFKYFLENMCTEESYVMYLVMTKNLFIKYPDIKPDAIFTVFPELEVHPDAE